jgi:hypothetical protein
MLSAAERGAKLEQKLALAEELLQAEQVAHSKLQADTTLERNQAALNKVSQSAAEKLPQCLDCQACDFCSLLLVCCLLLYTSCTRQAIIGSRSLPLRAVEAVTKTSMLFAAVAVPRCRNLCCRRSLSRHSRITQPSRHDTSRQSSSALH